MNIAIVGVSGAVGQELLKVLTQQQLQVDKLLLFGSERSAGKRYHFREQEISVQRLGADPLAFSDVDFAFVSAGASTSRQYADMITNGGAIMIDNSSAFRMDTDVPLVVPEVNGQDALNAPRRIIANPNCTTIQMVVALNPIQKLSPIRRVHVATYQAASGAGAKAMHELVDQHRQLLQDKEVVPERFAHQLAYNVIPHIDVFVEDDYTKEEMKMHHETKKIMHSSDLEVSATCVRVPVMRAHSEAIWVETEQAISVMQAREAFSQAPGVVLVDDPHSLKYPMPLHSTGLDPVYVGRVRRDLSNEHGLAFWCVSDQIRKGAALNAVQIMNYLLSQ